MRLNHNLASLNVYAAYSKALTKQNIALNKISSGYKVNSAKDDPNAIAQSERIRMQVRGLQMAGQNAQDGVSMLQSAEGGLDGMTSMLQRVRDLVVQSGDGSTTEADKKIMQNEIDQMISGMDETANNTEFNGVSLLKSGNSVDDKNINVKSMPIGANAGQSIDIPMYNLQSNMIPKQQDPLNPGNCLADLKSGGAIDISKGGNQLDTALNIVDSSLDAIVSVRSKYGALENRFEGSLQNINEISEKEEGADSNLRDADIAQEMMEYSKDNILTEAGNAMMVQTNKFPQDALRVLENVTSK